VMWDDEHECEHCAATGHLAERGYYCCDECGAEYELELCGPMGSDQHWVCTRPGDVPRHRVLSLVRSLVAEYRADRLRSGCGDDVAYALDHIMYLVRARICTECGRRLGETEHTSTIGDYRHACMHCARSERDATSTDVPAPAPSIQATDIDTGEVVPMFRGRDRRWRGTPITHVPDDVLATAIADCEADDASRRAKYQTVYDEMCAELADRARTAPLVSDAERTRQAAVVERELGEDSLFDDQPECSICRRRHGHEVTHACE